MPYDINSNASPSDISDAVNYLLNNFTVGLSSNPNSGEVVGPTGVIVGYLYKYIAIKYADSQDGTVNFSNVPTNRLYYGIRNTDSTVESTNPTDYIWNLVTGGFGTTKLLWYAVTGGRQILFAVSTLIYNVGYVQDIGVAIDLDVITSSLTSDSFGTTFSPSTLQVPYTNAPVFTGVIPRLYGTNAYGAVDFVASQTDSDAAFVNNTWRIGNSSTTGYGDIVQTNITIANPSDGGSFAQWPVPTAMTANTATLAVPVRYRDNAGTIRQAALSTIQFVFSYGGKNATICYALYAGNPTVTGAAVTTAGTNTPATTDFSPTSATAFTYAVQAPGPSQAMFQSDGIYDPVANTTNWNTPYLSNLKVGSLSAITVNTGGLIVSDYIRAQSGGVTPAVSGSSMSGAGAVINSGGSFAYGSSARNLSFDGSTLTMNGDLVVTGNIVNSAVTRVATVYANSTVTGSGLGVYYTLASLNITTSVDCFIYALFTAKQNYGGIFNPTSVTALFIDGNATSVGGQSVQTNIAISLSVFLAAGVHTVSVIWDASSSLISVTDRSLYVQGSQR
tara:strand:+ start:63 stop:1742 length:1680 start_codon:yes stop_codon:yes gene_type:complete